MERADRIMSPSIVRLLGDQAASFFSASYEQHWVHVSGRTPNHFSDLFSLDKAETLLWKFEQRYRELVRFHRDGKDVVQPSSLSSFDQFSWATNQFREGTTIIFNTLEDCCPDLALFVRDIETHLIARVSAAAYITPLASRAFVEHFDSHDVLIAQIEGKKTYSLRRSENVAFLPHRRQQSEIDPNKEPAAAANVTLVPGDVLYIPRGVLHAAHSEDHHSIHLTFSLHPVRYGDLATTALELAFERSVALRHSLKSFGHDDLAKELVERLASALSVDLDVHEVFTRQRQKAVARLRPLPGRRLALGISPPPLTAADCVEKVPGTMLAVALFEGELRIAYPGTGVIRDADRMPTRLEMPQAAHAAIRFIDEADGPFYICEIPGPLSQKSNVLLSDFLLREGLLQRVKVK